TTSNSDYNNRWHHYGTRCCVCFGIAYYIFIQYVTWNGDLVNMASLLLGINWCNEWMYRQICKTYSCLYVSTVWSLLWIFIWVYYIVSDLPSSRKILAVLSFRVTF